MASNRIFVIGASAGGVEALKQLVALLPADFPSPILIVLHVPPHGTSMLPAILSRAGRLPAKHALDGEHIYARKIYIAPPDHHLLVKKDHLRLSLGPRENNSRPAVDVLFRSAARDYRRRVVGIVLSGGLDDGTAGLSVIKALGGIAIVQDPEDALYPGMPQSAVENVDVDYILPLIQIPDLMVKLAAEQVETGPKRNPEDVEYEIDMVDPQETDDMSLLDEDNPNRPGVPSNYVCPECGGALYEIIEGDVLRFRCHVGHAYSAETFLASQTESVEAALWVALRVLEDNMSITRKMAERARKIQHAHTAEKFEQRAANAEAQAKIVRDVLMNGLRPELNTDDGTVPPPRSTGST